jgi:Zn-dependent membrane protease YugP
VATVNLTPILIALLYVAGAGFALGILIVALGFLFMVVTAPFRVVAARRNGESPDEIDEIVVFFGSIALLIAFSTSPPVSSWSP